MTTFPHNHEAYQLYLKHKEAIDAAPAGPLSSVWAFVDHELIATQEAAAEDAEKGDVWTEEQKLRLLSHSFAEWAAFEIRILDDEVILGAADAFDYSPAAECAVLFETEVEPLRVEMLILLMQADSVAEQLGDILFNVAMELAGYEMIDFPESVEAPQPAAA